MEPDLAPEGLERVPDNEVYWTKGRIAASVTVVLLVAFWIGIWTYGLSSENVRRNPDELRDQTYVARADAACEAARAEIESLGSAMDVGSPAERADLLDKSNPVVARLVRQLDVIEVDNADDREILDKWIADWDTYVSDREAHAERLRTEGDVRFVITDVGTAHVTVRIDGFARVNDMNNCEVPLDL